MRVVFRADSGIEQGTGHVMRCLTLAEELMTRGHDVHLMTGPVSIEWLRVVIQQSAVTMHSCEPDDLPESAIIGLSPDWLVVDSYRITADSISAANRSVPVLAIIDGGSRSIEATLYLDQNLGAEDMYKGLASVDRYLLGSSFALVRNAVLASRRERPGRFLSSGEPRVLCFMGGTDPLGSIVAVVRSLDRVSQTVRLTVVAPRRHHNAILGVLSDPSRARLLVPTPRLPSLLAETDIAISAAGTSAWDICALGIPSVLVAVVANQQVSLHEAVSRGLTLGVDAVAEGLEAMDAVGTSVTALLNDSSLRDRLSDASRSTFDGLGASRVALRMELANGEPS